MQRLNPIRHTIEDERMIVDAEGVYALAVKSDDEDEDEIEKSSCQSVKVFPDQL